MMSSVIHLRRVEVIFKCKVLRVGRASTSKTVLSMRVGLVLLFVFQAVFLFSFSVFDNTSSRIESGMEKSVESVKRDSHGVSVWKGFTNSTGEKEGNFESLVMSKVDVIDRDAFRRIVVAFDSNLGKTPANTVAHKQCKVSLRKWSFVTSK